MCFEDFFSRKQMMGTVIVSFRSKEAIMLTLTFSYVPEIHSLLIVKQKFVIFVKLCINQTKSAHFQVPVQSIDKCYNNLLGGRKQLQVQPIKNLHLTKYILAQNSNDRGLVTSYTRHATSQSSSVGVNISHMATSTSWSCKAKCTSDVCLS